jgi:hypothetical protein
MRSGVAGENSSRTSSTPESFRADLIASRMAKKTEEPMNNGGSPTTELVFMKEYRARRIREGTSAGSLDGLEIFPFDVLEETDSEILRNIPVIRIYLGCGDTMQMEFCKPQDRG